MANEQINHVVDSAKRVESDTYDRGIIPAEIAARKEREGDLYKTLPTEERAANSSTDDQTNAESINTTDGYTVDKEGLLNNYAVEPEMYYEVPGDARQQIAEDTAQRMEQLREIKESPFKEDGERHDRGSGMI